jgi:hypothetical protein
LLVPKTIRGLLRDDTELMSFIKPMAGARYAEISPAATAVQTTTSHGGHFQNASNKKAASPSPKSLQDRMPLLQTGS